MFEYAQTTLLPEDGKAMTVIEQILLEATFHADHDTVHQLLTFLRPDTAAEISPAVVGALITSVSEQLETAPPAEQKRLERSHELMTSVLLKHNTAAKDC